jgi:hypothetical protein
MAPGFRPGLFFIGLFLFTLALRLCHARLLWADEDYHLSAAIQTLHGKLLYRDIWYDKPPLSALLYAAVGAPSGWVLRVFDSLYVTAVCGAVAALARELWGLREAWIAAAAMAFFLAFDLPASVIPIAPDFFMMLPHLLAVLCAWRGRAFAAGVWCGVAFLFNTKAVFVAVVCAVIAWPGLPMLAAGICVPCAAAGAVLAATGALSECVRQVWEWGVAYARSPIAANPVANAMRRTADWAGFHAALVIGAACMAWKERNRTAVLLGVWALVSLAAVLSGWRVFPRYFLQLLPLAVVAFARGVTILAGMKPAPRALGTALIVVAALVPAVRFGPRYFMLAEGDMQWRDIGLDRDSRAAADWINAHKRASDTLVVWGYRPDIFVFTRLPWASRFGDSQPLTGVPADRHLFDATPLTPEWAIANRRELAASSPTFIVDGLGPLNPRLAITSYADLARWLAQYEPAHTTTLTVIYRRRFSCVNAGPACVHFADLWMEKPHFN